MAPRSFEKHHDPGLNGPFTMGVRISRIYAGVYIYIDTFQYYTQSNTNTQVSSFYRKTTCPENLMVIFDLPIDSVEPF